MPECTFWEKATAIHAYCLKGTFCGGGRCARHWYDLDCLDCIAIASEAIVDCRLAEDFANHKQHFFRETDQDGNVINCQAAVSGALYLIPSGEALEALTHDYQRMREAGLLQSDVLSFDTPIERTSNPQDRANAAHN
ncbi:nucleotidyl transferase AbiEii/AbiGii toxin family protein [uncultured Roseobacter sp.]|uniref:nucleotidyl transferase AbiEii/AbiGii toxin family protein n=1 Tax=uncultured Roseobacter sp. TaxID=114847 RepID=UPI00261A5C36|nr:nucleotidyl transferase AbiEii/AbiGii toxin family protein [uncultured Roseobacter sp.]